MGQHRVKKYYWVPPEGEKELKEFTLYHAEEARTVLEPDGIVIVKAIKLVKKWNRQAPGRYGIPFCKID